MTDQDINRVIGGMISQRRMLQALLVLLLPISGGSLYLAYAAKGIPLKGYADALKRRDWSIFVSTTPEPPPLVVVMRPPRPPRMVRIPAVCPAALPDDPPETPRREPGPEPQDTSKVWQERPAPITGAYRDFAPPSIVYRYYQEQPSDAATPSRGRKIVRGLTWPIRKLLRR
jgi:hypothetical protein